jgi:hypothetical protein
MMSRIESIMHVRISEMKFFCLYEFVNVESLEYESLDVESVNIESFDVDQ